MPAERVGRDAQQGRAEARRLNPEAARRSGYRSAQELARDDRALDLGRARADLHQLRVARDPLDRVVARVAVAAEHLHRREAGARGDLAREELRGRRQLRARPPPARRTARRLRRRAGARPRRRRTCRRSASAPSGTRRSAGRTARARAPSATEWSSAACARPTEIPAKVARSTSSPRIIMATPRFSSPIRSRGLDAHRRRSAARRSGCRACPSCRACGCS